MRAYGQKLVKFCTLTHAAKLVVRISTFDLTDAYKIAYFRVIGESFRYWCRFLLCLM